MCGITTAINQKEHNNETLKVIPIAGEYLLSGDVGGGDFDPKWTRLSTSNVQSDRDKEGLRLTMGGGRYPKAGAKNSRLQRAVVEFLCDRKETEDKRGALFLREEDTGEGNYGEDDSNNGESKEKEQTDDGEGGTLKYISYDLVGKDKVLSLEWRTKHACEDAAEGGGNSSSGHWGFFTWFIIM